MRRLPATMKLRGNTSKWILRQCAQTLLPQEVLTRSKQGFAVPIGRWFAERRLCPDPHTGINPLFWQRLLDEHTHHRGDHRIALHALQALAGLGAQTPAEAA